MAIESRCISQFASRGSWVRIEILAPSLRRNFSVFGPREKLISKYSTMSSQSFLIKKYSIAEHLRRGCSQRTIAKEFNVSKSFVQQVSAKIKNGLPFERPVGSGRPEKLTLAIKNAILTKYDQNLFSTLQEIANYIESEHNLRLSRSTIRNALYSFRLENRKPFKFGGGSVLAWGCISSNGVGRLVFIDGIMTAAHYVQILAQNLNQSAGEMSLTDFEFMHDNDPKHTARVTRKFLEEEKIKTINWPAQSPDLNPIEHVWAYIKFQLRNMGRLDKETLKQEVLKIWNNLPPELIRKYVLSFHKRVLEVYKTKGKHINY
ncbi:uncharacterized protein LOC115228811 [Octopus sinensis]|uniref:Uncharacterized protein LOC115228811 n=1 Tax=Octopus sinensis TaxID=2607531 RepID=A0A6P7TZ03_9MOLL|nr:uncharacterized protein LOC115228811 [Octopus sinensis]